MARVKFTAGRVGGFACPPERQQAFLWDEQQPGLGLRATPNGRPAFVFQAIYQGKTVRVTIGDPDAWSIAEARAKTRELQREIDEGRDPRNVKRAEIAATVAERDAKKAAKARAVTVGDVWPVYLQEGKPKRRDAWKPRYRADLEAMALPGGEKKKRGQGTTRPGPLHPLMAMRLDAITEDRLKDWFDREARASKHQAARALMMFRGFLRWCATKPEYRTLVDRDVGRAPAIVEALPQVKKRQDCLEAAQVSEWWQAVAQLPNVTASAYLRALLLTGARREEVASLRWADIDMRWRKLRLADKVDATRTIPLSDYLAELLAELPRRSEFVFASASKTGRIADARSSHERALGEAGITGLTIHGLRRSFSLLGEAAGAPAGAIAQVMGHRPSATAEGYRPRSVDALRPFLQQIETHILKLAGVEIKRADKPGKLRAVTS
ncbi:integrase family protein [Ramlibacter sp. AW1]|uniref:Integrase family protein n=1 Tax=Ramlibacter aurantiacus TaxID=2801330 RepID=A0A936ZM59_9BURK|nr:integrase family protein [Ramlibacter aurantiacus]MBL0420241.1 integrase family protein [Ramlibacter aurantiacus]